MIVDLAKKFAILDKKSIKLAEKIQQAENESKDRDLTRTPNNSPLHLQLPALPSNSQVCRNRPPSADHPTLRKDCSSKELPSLIEYKVQMSSTGVHKNHSSRKTSSKSSVEANKICIGKMTPRVRSKRQKKPAISSESYTYGISKTKNKL